MALRVRVQLLGPVRAVAAEGPLLLRGKTARTVLARLALSAGSVVSADQLADALWHDDPPHEPSASLRSVVSRLRTQLGSDAITTVGAGYQLNTAVVAVDLADVEVALRQTDLHQSTPEELRELLTLWDGDALADVAWTPAFEPERTRIEELRARLLDTYHESMIIHGRAGETVADLERDAAAAPLRESTQLLLMRALDACGRTAEAVRAGDNYRTHLIDQTGLDPSANYEALALSLLASDRARRDAATPQDLDARVAEDRPSRRTWVPPDTPFVGRTAELEELAQLAALRRLVTITGPGGVGKTRLVTEFINSVANAGSTGFDMVSLAGLERFSDVGPAVATALGIEGSSRTTVEAITDRMAYDAPTLVLDNCEHVLSSARLLVQHLLRNVADLHVIVTSRRRFGLPDEAVLEVGPLIASPANTVEDASMLLFLDRVERSAPRLTITDEDLAMATDICRLLDGLPLALELAAVRVPMFGFAGLRQRLVDGLAVPGATATDDDRRQATIESTVAWSLDLLSDEAQQIFDELSIFPSWFDLAGLEYVSRSDRTIDAFTEIHDSSLVVVDQQRPAYRLLEPVRQVARRRVDPELLPKVVDRYLSWVTAVTDRIEQHWMRDECAAAQQLILDHRADIRWSLSRFVEQGDAAAHGRIAKLLSRALVERADLEIIALCRADVGPSLDGMLARLTLAWAQGDLAAAEELVGELGNEIGPGHDLWEDYNWASIAVHLYRGDTDRVAEAAAIVANNEACYPFMRAESVALWACALLYGGRRDEAISLMEEKEGILELSDCQGFVAYTRAELVAADDPDLAISHLATASRQAKAAKNSFSQRLTDVSRLVRLIDSGHHVEASRLSVRLIPQLIQAGTYPQTWTAMRHIADLLGQVGRPTAGLLVLRSANAAASAPAVTGDGVVAEQELTRRLEKQAARPNDEQTPLSLVPLWESIEAILRSDGSVP